MNVIFKWKLCTYEKRIRDTFMENLVEIIQIFKTKKKSEKNILEMEGNKNSIFVSLVQYNILKSAIFCIN